MFNQFINHFGNFQQQNHHHNHHQQQQQQQQQQEDKSPPPASQKILRSLPVVNVTSDDLLEETNKECAICLEDQLLGSKACKLPCGHLYHLDCLKDWLQKCCTCPVCRFELETDDSSYEKERVKRMKTRKLRYRRDEIQHMKASQLIELAKHLSVNIVGLLDKGEITDKLVKSGKIEITEGVPIMEMTKTEFLNKGVADLRRLLLSFGISDVGAIEKSELRDRLLESHRIELINDTIIEENLEKEIFKSNDNSSSSSNINAPDINVKSNNNININNDNNNTNSNFLFGKSSSSPPLQPSYDAMLIEENELKSMSIRDIKHMLDSFQLSTDGCLYKDDLIKRLLNAGKIKLV
jgi:hypothetical protein